MSQNHYINQNRRFAYCRFRPGVFFDRRNPPTAVPRLPQPADRSTQAPASPNPLSTFFSRPIQFLQSCPHRARWTSWCRIPSLDPVGIAKTQTPSYWPGPMLRANCQTCFTLPIGCPRKSDWAIETVYSTFSGFPDNFA